MCTSIIKNNKINKFLIIVLLKTVILHYNYVKINSFLALRFFFLKNSKCYAKNRYFNSYFYKECFTLYLSAIILKICWFNFGNFSYGNTCFKYTNYFNTPKYNFLNTKLNLFLTKYLYNFDLNLFVNQTTYKFNKIFSQNI